MILSEGLMQKVFMVYGGFWLTVLVALFFGVGALVKRGERHGKHDSH